MFFLWLGDITIFDQQFHFSCGVQCRYKDIIWADTQQDIYLYWWIGFWRSFIVFPAIIMAMINHIMEIKYSDIKYRQRSTIFHLYIPMMIILIVFETFMIISGAFGRNYVVCSKDLNDILTIVINNRSRGHFACSFSAIFLDTLGKLRQLYSIMFCLLLWKQFFAPLRSLSEELQEKQVCKPCCCLVQTCTQNYLCQKCVDTLKQCDMESTRISESDATYAYLCSRTFHVHCFVFLLTGVLEIVHYTVSNQQPLIFVPTCLPALDETANHLWLVILEIPFYLEIIVYGTFFPNAAYLLCKFMRYNQHDNQNNIQIIRLGKRLLGFYVFLVIEFCSILLFRILFATVQEDMSDGIWQRISCMYSGSPYEDCLSVGYRYPKYLTCIQLLAIWPTVSMVFLTLNQTARERWSIICSSVYQTICCVDITVISLKRENSSVTSAENIRNLNSHAARRISSTLRSATQTSSRRKSLTSSTRQDNSIHDHENTALVEDDTQTQTHTGIELSLDTSLEQT